MPKLMTLAEGILLEKLITGALPTPRRNRTAQLLYVFSILTAIVATCFLMVAFHAWAQSVYTPEMAALATAGAIFGLAAVLALAAFAVGQQRQIKRDVFKAQIKSNIKSAIDSLDDELGDQIRENPMAAVLLAGLAGFIAAETVH